MLQLLVPGRHARNRERERERTREPRTHPGLSLLVERGALDQAEADRALATARARREPLPLVLARDNLVSGREWARVIAERYGLERATELDFPPEPLLGDRFSGRFLRQAWVLPLAIEDERLWLAMADPADEAAIKAVRLAANREVVPVVVAVEDLEQVYQRYFESGRSALQQIVDDIEVQSEADGADVEQLIDRAKEAPVVRLVQQLLNDAMRMRASDIHIEPFRDRLQVRYRIHGRLTEIGSPPVRLSAAVVSRIKILAKLDIAERRLPQDGRAQLTLQGRRIDLRVATMPTIHGESLVIRLLDHAAGAVGLSELGLEASVEERLRQMLASPHGMILVTGPTGSGKTTTLYAALKTLDAQRDKIISIEDPIEYQIDGITQIQVKPEIELSFARILRSVVRHDPNIVMVGETRDPETADIAVHAALTGHLLLSTLHTNSAAGAVARLLDMEVEPYLLASVLRGVIGQRLVGILCDACKEPYPASPDELHVLEEGGVVERARIRSNGAFTLYRPVGCRHCAEIGFTGRLGIFEVLTVEETTRELIRARAPTQEILKDALARNMTTMFADGLDKVMRGITTLEEVRRVTEDW